MSTDMNAESKAVTRRALHNPARPAVTGPNRLRFAGTTWRRPEIRLSWLSRLSDGDLGPLPVIIGLAVIWVFFAYADPHFLTARNLSNLILQMAVLGTISLGLVTVLVMGEIDLSVAAVSGFCGGIFAIGLQHGWPAPVMIVVALLAGAVIGLLQGSIATLLGIPSFVVTLTGLLVWQGLLLLVIGDQGDVAISDPFIRSIANSYLTPASGWALGAVLVAGFVAMTAAKVRAERSNPGHGLSLAAGAWRVSMVVVAVVVTVAVLNSYFGVPWLLVILVSLTLLATLVMSQTPLGRHIYAIGGNRDAARRAGIKVLGVVVLVFVIGATLASFAGILDASRQFSVSNGAGGGDLELNAIAAVVIGGTSLFGGRGKPYHALLGALVVGSVSNGLDLLGQSAGVQDAATGLILLVAVSLDAFTRRRRIAAGRAG
ncbi:MAG TPA: hypothetical protein VG317_10065 [Pseudonocardiaceae bacterium]|jgi:D-xylose transport system permease protein|nr:hypothetical protein [Pseudonocardiaceae bacterium]